LEEEGEEELRVHKADRLVEAEDLVQVQELEVAMEEVLQDI